MAVASILACLLSAQQLTIEPTDVVVGQEVVVEVRGEAAPLAGITVSLQSPDGLERVVGTSDRDGRLRVMLAAIGRHVFTAEVDGVRCVTPIGVQPARRRWLLALGCVPLGLASLWWQVRHRAPRAP